MTNVVIYLSLTTRPERLISDHFKKVYTSLKDQTFPYNKMIINLSVNEFEYEIPDYLHSDHNIILNKTSICGPCTKLLGSIDIIPQDTVVIVLDDDIVMKDIFIQSLYCSYLINPDKVSSHFINVRTQFTEIAGFGGYIFNINHLRGITQFYDSMPLCCIKIDDTWISWCIKKLNIDIVQTIEKNPWNNVLDIKNTDPHPDWYELCKHSDRTTLTDEALSLLL
jgi:hypothetical protein